MNKHLSLFICTLALLLSPLFAKAAAVSPSVIELSSPDGKVINSSFTIFNTRASEQVYFLDLLAFEPNSQDGTPVFTPDTSDQNEFLSWIHFPVREVPVPAQSKVEVPFTVVIPDDEASGSYYGAVTVSTAPSDVVASNGATIEAKTAILVFLTVEGETVEKLELLDFSATQSDASLPFGTFQYRLQNQGNVHLMPVGEITLTGLFGQTVGVLNANEAQGRILPSSTRTYEVTFNGDTSWFAAAGYQLRHLAIGPVTVDVTLTYGETGTLEAQTIVWVMPWQLMSLLVMGILVVVLFYKRIAKR
ncbi:hypothetical protein EPN81_04395 [Patescibacteria group bacterium]|nr:MAG: hypothetical protein EPN81_04395 [Patescibacteria group bacterium]